MHNMTGYGVLQYCVVLGLVLGFPPGPAWDDRMKQRTATISIPEWHALVSTFESICSGILPLWNLDFRITTRPLFKQAFIEYYILDNED
jgi:hypothetical protein